MAKPTKKKLAQKCMEYFNAIRYTEKVTRQVTTGRKDEYGHDEKIAAPVITADGSEATVTCWTTIPNIEALCLRLHASRAEWDAWRADEKLAPVCDTAENIIKAALISMLDGKNSRGVIFLLERSFGMKESSEVVITGGVEDYLRKLRAEGGGQEL